MTLREFQNVLTELFGSEYWDDHMELLFNKVDTSCDGYVDWDEFCTYMLLQYKEKDYIITRKTTFVGPPLIKFCLRNKQEPTSRILAITHPPPLWFVSVSKGGILTVWNAALQPQKSYEITSDSSDAQSGKRRFKSWTTDAVYMSNVHKLAVATTSRDIHFFDVSTMNMFEEFHLFGLNHIPTCFTYWFNEKSPGDCSLLLWGDDSGGVNLLRILKPNSGVFEKPFSQQPAPQNVFMQELKDHSSLLAYQAIPDVHPEAVTKLLYVPEQELIITSSGSCTTSLVIMDIQRKGKTYTWNINKGIQCFDYCKTLNLLVTGGLDHKVRLWNQYVPSRPIAVLSEHTLPILDVVIYEPLNQLFSYSKDSVLKVWDIFSHSCLQTLVLKFPCLQPGRIHEQGNFPFLLVPRTPPQLLVTYSDYVGMLRLAQPDLHEEALVTHDTPLSAVLYNSFFHQVVTASEDSTVIVWDVETGTKCLLLDNVHGCEEITCMAFDRSQRKLITGARNGTLKVWNIQNGHNLHRLQPVEEAEVTCVLPLRDQTFLSVGWNRKIVLYDITNVENLYVSADAMWRGGHPHKEDILTADFCPSLGLLVTGSFDGEIIVWNVETQRVYLYLRKCPHNRPNPPVDKVLFLHHRASLKDAAILISSEAGTLRWWSVFAHQKTFGYFYAPNKTDESVFGLSSCENDNLLVSGDTSGFIHVWDVSQYGLRAIDQLREDRPPLLFSFKAHDGTIVSVESFLLDSEHFIVSGSSDRTARLWTQDGKCVGTFGQSKPWKLRNPATYQDGWTEESKSKQRANLPKSMEDQREKGGETSNRQGGESARAGTKSAENPRLGGTCPTGSDETGLIHEVLPGRALQDELTKKPVSKKERRLLGAEIDLGKCHRFGQLCSPFQALVTSEVQEVPLPRNLSMRMASYFGSGSEEPDWTLIQDANQAASRKPSQTLHSIQPPALGIPPRSHHL
uniref:EF-hand domain-containing protein n=1 Tax=Leptobrachium leishanense TaxID=445787 RepID=A0A8C5R5F8_9ANUR